MTEPREPHANHVHIPALMEEIGLPELSDIGTEKFISYAVPAALAGVADGDVKIPYPERLTGMDAEMFGETEAEQGVFTQAIRQAAIDAGPNPGPMRNFQDFLVTAATEPQSNYYHAASPRFARVIGQNIIIHDSAFALPHPPQLLIEYGACMESRAQVDAQLESLQIGSPPYAYSPLARTHFANQSILATYRHTKLAQRLQTEARTDLQQLVLDRRLFAGREDGEDSATQEIIRANTAVGAPVAVADVILAVSAQHTTPESLEAAVRRSHTILREGGALVIRGMQQPIAGEVAIDDIAQWALTSGFDENRALFFGGKLNLLSRQLESWGSANDDYVAGILVK